MTYDLAIIGAGPAGVAAGVYASRKQLKTILISDEWGGQSTASSEIQNWIGIPSISGVEFGKVLKEHLMRYAESCVEVVEGEKVVSLDEREKGLFSLKTTTQKTYEAKTVLIASGASRRKLEAEGADIFEYKGLTYCASCDGPLFSGMDVAVIGGGNAGFETAAQLLAYAKSVTLLHRSERFKADPITIEKVLKSPNMKALTNAETKEIKGEKFVSGLVYRDKKTNEEHTLAVTGVFVEIGLIPATDFAKDLVDFDDFKRIKVDSQNQRASRNGVWAAGDCGDGLYHQNNIAAGDAVKALEDIYLYLKAR